eukprot:7205353-Alexandrium_andersonii.AAC.1
MHARGEGLSNAERRVLPRTSRRQPKGERWGARQWQRPRVPAPDNNVGRTGGGGGGHECLGAPR